MQRLRILAVPRKALWRSKCSTLKQKLTQTRAWPGRASHLFYSSLNASARSDFSVRLTIRIQLHSTSKVWVHTILMNIRLGQEEPACRTWIAKHEIRIPTTTCEMSTRCSRRMSRFLWYLRQGSQWVNSEWCNWTCSSRTQICSIRAQLKLRIEISKGSRLFVRGICRISKQIWARLDSRMLR